MPVDLILINFEGLLVFFWEGGGRIKRTKLKSSHCQRNQVIISGKQSVARVVLPRFLYHWFSAQGAKVPRWLGSSHYRSFMITLRHITFGRGPLDECSARRGNLYLTTHNTHKRQISMSPVGFEPAIPASKQPQNHVLNGAATGIDPEH